jgi:hypothetical protein
MANTYVPLDSTLGCNGYTNVGTPTDENINDPFNLARFSAKVIKREVADNNNNIFDALEAMNLAHPVLDNSTGVPWWPGDSIFAMQIYRVDRVDSPTWSTPYTIYRDSLLDADGAPNLFSVATGAGLYNSVFTDDHGNSAPLIFEITANKEQYYQLSNYFDANIYPNPMTGGTVYV